MYESWWCRYCGSITSTAYSPSVCIICGKLCFINKVDDGTEVAILLREQICVLKDAIEDAIAKLREAGL
jgi:hypothetical protein